MRTDIEKYVHRKKLYQAKYLGMIYNFLPKEIQNIKEIGKTIVLKGHVQLTTEQRHKMTEVKRKQIITQIVQNAINPQTKAPHTVTTIENAMNEAKIHIDPFKSTNTQVKEVLKAIKILIPIKFEKIKLAIKVSGDNYGKIYGDVVGFGKLIEQEWLKDASWVGVVEIPAGIQNELIDIISKKTKGEVDIKLR